MFIPKRAVVTVPDNKGKEEPPLRSRVAALAAALALAAPALAAAPGAVPMEAPLDNGGPAQGLEAAGLPGIREARAAFLAAPPRDVSGALALQAGVLGGALPGAPLAAPTLDAALGALFQAHGTNPTPDEAAALAELGALPAPVQAALALVLDAAARAQLAARAAFADLSAEDAAALAGADAAADPDRLLGAALRVDRLGMLGAQEGLARAVLQALPVLEAHALPMALLEEPWPDTAAPTGPGPRITVSNVLAMDLAGQDNHYGQDYAVVIDLVGRDVYRNQAGGSGRTGADLGSLDHALGTLGNAGVLVDLFGDDQYLGYATPAPSAGVNGGGYLGSGFLFDLAGADTYAGALRNRGAMNGGASFGGVGLLWDTSGPDGYDGRLGMGGALNGGGAFGGVGLLRDEEGDDAYRGALEKRLPGPDGGEGAVNGGGQFLGVGMLLDELGDDVREGTAERGAFNGGGWGGAGFLFDGGGSDRYGGFGRAGAAVNGCGGSQGAGTLVDRAGDDVYAAVLNAAGSCANGAGNLGRGALLDGAGHDRYDVVVQTAHASANGGARGGQGFLLDAYGHDTYLATVTQGAGPAAVHGAAMQGGEGRLLDVEGDDAYLVAFLGAPGGTVHANGAGSVGQGLLLDLVGHDRYQDEPGEAPAFDESIVPKGTGIQLDQ